MRPSLPVPAVLGRLLPPRTVAATESALLVPAPEADVVYGRWSGDAANLRAPGMPLHVTVLYPFLEPPSIDETVERELETLARSHRPFGYTLRQIDRFPEVLYLSPSPTDGFVELTRAVHARWPSHPPYGGAYEEIMPHVTLALGDEPPGLAAVVAQELPIQAVARELVLLERRAGIWSPRSHFALGGTN